MPHLDPPEGDTGWPAGEGTLGVVGVAPWATLDFLEAFYRGVSASKDWHYPRVIVDVNTKLPSRGRHLELGETDPSPYIEATIRELAAAGATAVVVACNTAHILQARWSAGHTCEVISIISATITAVEKSRPQGPVVVLASRSLTQSGTYQAALSDAGLASLGLSHADVDRVARAIEVVKTAGSLDDRAQEDMADIARTAAAGGALAAIVGCTELSSAGPIFRDAGLAVFDSNLELANAALDHCTSGGRGVALGATADSPRSAERDQSAPEL